MRVGRTLPPVGYRFGIGRLARGVCDAVWGSRSLFEQEIKAYFGVRHAFPVSSGKAALTVVLRALKALTGRKKVILPAYTCYSVPSSIVKAGLELVPCDIAPGSFDYDYGRLVAMLGPDILCVLSVHLFGIPSDTRRVNDLCRGKGIFVVEDAAQAMGGASGGALLGTLGDVGFYSLGRGKNLTCGSGGVIVTDSAPIGAAIARVLASADANGILHGARAGFTLFLLSIFVSPRLYWLPAGLPFLRLGETIFHEDFPIRRLSAFETALLRGWQDLLASLNASRRQHSDFYCTHIDGARGRDSTVPYLRFPLLVERAQKERLLSDNDGRALGISLMYPTSVAGIEQLRSRFDPGQFPEADNVAASLITLPTHPLVSDRDRARICDLVNLVQQPSSRRPAA